MHSSVECTISTVKMQTHKLKKKTKSIPNRTSYWIKNDSTVYHKKYDLRMNRGCIVLYFVFYILYFMCASTYTSRDVCGSWPEVDFRVQMSICKKYETIPVQNNKAVRENRDTHELTHEKIKNISLSFTRITTVRRSS